MNSFEQLVEILIKNEMMISAAESCTGGMFASGIVSVPNASKVLSSSYVTYSNESKTELVGVSSQTIEKFTVVSESVAVEMARGVCKKAGADVGVGITGYAGPAVDKNDTLAGTVCFGFCIKGKTFSSTKEFGDIGRNVVRELSVNYAVQSLLRLLNSFGEK